MKAPRYGPMLIAAALFACLLFLPEHDWVSILPKDLLLKSAASSDINRFKNVLLQEGAYNNSEYLPMYGSSTIAVFSNYHPVNVFPSVQGDPVPFLVGQSSTTSIIHLLNFSAVSGNLQHKKLVIMLDPSDFMNPNGMSDQRFGQLYNPLQGYSFIFNSELSQADRRREAARLLHYSTIKKDPLLSTLLEGIIHPNFWKELNNVVKWPQAYIYLRVLEKQDILHALHFEKNLKPYKNHQDLSYHQWDQLMIQAEKTALSQASDNPYGFVNDAYKKSIAPNFSKLKNSWKPGNYLQSVEYGDFGAILDILKREKADPLFVLIPRKGAWSDYIGFSKAYREKLYNKIKDMVAGAGFSVIDYSDYEYDNYFMRDPNHLGWTGWVHLDEDLLSYFQGHAMVTSK